MPQRMLARDGNHDTVRHNDGACNSHQTDRVSGVLKYGHDRRATNEMRNLLDHALYTEPTV